MSLFDFFDKKTSNDRTNRHKTNGLTNKHETQKTIPNTTNTTNENKNTTKLKTFWKKMLSWSL